MLEVKSTAIAALQEPGLDSLPAKLGMDEMSPGSSKRLDLSTIFSYLHGNLSSWGLHLFVADASFQRLPSAAKMFESLY